MATHTRVLALARHTDTARQNFRSVPNSPEHANSRSWQRDTSWESPHNCVVDVARVPTLNKRQKTQTVGCCSSPTGCKGNTRDRSQDSRKSVTVTLKTEACSFSTRAPTERPLRFGLQRKALTKIPAHATVRGSSSDPTPPPGGGSIRQFVTLFISESPVFFLRHTMDEANGPMNDHKTLSVPVSIRP